MKLGTFLALLLLALSACRTVTNGPSDPKAEFSPSGIPIDWGSLQPMSTTPLTVESKLANAAARRLNEASQLKSLLVGFPSDFEVVDGIVSVPIKMLSNDDDGHNHPFGDGQKNASVGWAGWSSQNIDPPLVMTLAQVKSSSGDFRLFVLEPSTKMVESMIGGAASELSAELSSDQNEKFSIKLIKDAPRGVYRAIIVVGRPLNGVDGTQTYPATVAQAPAWLLSLSDRWAWPRVKVRFFSDSRSSDIRYWPVIFRFPVQTVDQAQASLPTSENSFSSSRRPISLPPYASPSAATASESLKSWFDSQAPSTKTADFYPAVGGSGVHNQFTDASGHVTPTATGGVDTYVVKEKVGKTQILYTCFDARNPSGEAQWGVPSGAGWHSIGHDLPGQSQENWTFAETLINSFEKTGIFAGWGVRTPYPYTEAAPYEAKDVVTFRVLRPNEAYATAKHHFHWYAVDASQKVCTIIWKHLGCSLKSDRDLKCSP